MKVEKGMMGWRESEGRQTDKWRVNMGGREMDDGMARKGS